MSTSAPGGAVGVDTRFGRCYGLRGQQVEEAEPGYGEGDEKGGSPEGQGWASTVALHAKGFQLYDDEVTLQTL
jgi:hypothetical protein